MKIAVIGAGSVGATLGRRFAEAGHEVVFGVRDPDAHRDKASFARVAAVADAVSATDVVVLAVPYRAVFDLAAKIGAGDGKIFVDCTNPLVAGAGGLSLEIGHDDSGAERIAAAFPGAKIVKCFNQVGFEVMAAPAANGRRAVMFVCGDHPDANAAVLGLAESIGFDAVDAGALRVARLLEPFAMLWIHLAFNAGIGRDFMFALERRG